jgi:hypothetical protein
MRTDFHVNTRLWWANASLRRQLRNAKTKFNRNSHSNFEDEILSLPFPLCVPFMSFVKGRFRVLLHRVSELRRMAPKGSVKRTIASEGARCHGDVSTR